MSFNEYTILVYESNIFYDDRIKIDFPQNVGDTTYIPANNVKFLSQNSQINEEKAMISNGKEGYVIYGPYVNDIKGNYTIEFDLEVLENKGGDIGYVEITSDFGNQLLARELINANGKNVLENVQFNGERELEFRIYQQNEMVISFKGLKITCIEGEEIK